MREPRSNRWSAVNGNVRRCRRNVSLNDGSCFWLLKYDGPTSKRPLNVYKSASGGSHSMQPILWILSANTFRFSYMCSNIRQSQNIYKPIQRSLGNPFGKNSVFKFVSPSKLAVVMKHFPSGSDVFSSTKSHGTSQSLEALTKSPWRIFSHSMSISVPFRITVTEKLKVKYINRLILLRRCLICITIDAMNRTYRVND